MRIAYLSCHSVLEHDEISLLNELGHYVFSPGAYVEPANPGDASLRPGLTQIKYDAGDINAWNAIECPPDVDRKDRLTREFVDRFDVVIVMHMPKWIVQNWKAISHKKVIWRTIGQSIYHNELELEPYRKQGMKIVRYSPKERTIPGFIGEDAMIRFYKDSEEFKDWNGKAEAVLTFNQHLRQRGEACNYATWEKATWNLPRILCGPGNEGLQGGFGKVGYEDLKQLMRDCRCYFYCGTHPASYTLNFIESYMTGIPVVAIGPTLGNSRWYPGHELYEVADIIENGRSGFVSDDVAELNSCCKQLLADPALAMQVGKAGRAHAIELFGKQTIKAQWNAYLETL